MTISGTHAGDNVTTLREHNSQIHALAWSPDGNRLASTSYDLTARIWDVASEKMVLGPLRHSHEITSVAWEPNGERLATGSIDETVKIWSTTTGREARHSAWSCRNSNFTRMAARRPAGLGGR